MHHVKFFIYIERFKRFVRLIVACLITAKLQWRFNRNFNCTWPNCIITFFLLYYFLEINCIRNGSVNSHVIYYLYTEVIGDLSDSAENKSQLEKTLPFHLLRTFKLEALISLKVCKFNVKLNVSNILIKSINRFWPFRYRTIFNNISSSLINIVFIGCLINSIVYTILGRTYQLFLNCIRVWNTHQIFSKTIFINNCSWRLYFVT